MIVVRRDAAAKTRAGKGRVVRLGWTLERAAIGVLASYLVFRLYALIVTGHVAALWLKDYGLYMDATRRWLAGGPFYPPEQLTNGPWEIAWGAILYPPITIAWLVPWSFLPSGLWLIVPPAIVLGMIIHWRPSVHGWLVILAILALDPFALLNFAAGTPSTWYVALAALSTRWRWVSALILTKPTLVPFGLVGYRDRRWWAVAGGLVILSLASWSLTLDWIRMALHGYGQLAGPLYSIGSYPMLFVPWVAWIARRRPPSPLPES
jgi:hypothetical protein